MYPFLAIQVKKKNNKKDKKLEEKKIFIAIV